MCVYIFVYICAYIIYIYTQNTAYCLVHIAVHSNIHKTHTQNTQNTAYCYIFTNLYVYAYVHIHMSRPKIMDMHICIYIQICKYIHKTQLIV